ncbi:MAG: cob(I)yrinic acid a,c-diamide adenosyltransferase [bacterium]|nr:cob(I)yrinic acid a,c-diamide adenosyltransferase [bacterium]
MDERIRGHKGLGLVSLFTGHGRGKTTAGLGTVVRALGAGKNVAMVYFDKGGDAHYSERKILDILGVEYYVTGRDRIDPVTNKFDFTITEEDKSEAERGLCLVQDIFRRNEHDLVVLDEINSTTNLGMLKEEKIISVIAEKPESMELLLTGRDAPESFKEISHLVTEMKLEKHYFYSGVQAREGIDY